LLFFGEVGVVRESGIGHSREGLQQLEIASKAGLLVLSPPPARGKPGSPQQFE